jgi:DNA polymerase III subunit chi
VATRVDFYVLEGSDARARLVYACRLIDKAFGLKQAVYVHLGSSSEAQAFDDLLWTYHDRSFVPHALHGTDAAATAPVVLGHDADAPDADLLVNLAPDVPEFFTRYARVAEFVDADPVRREEGRRRYASYRERGVKPETHTVGARTET